MADRSKKITELTSTSSVTANDVFVVVTDTATSAVTKKVTVGGVFSNVDANVTFNKAITVANGVNIATGALSVGGVATISANGAWVGNNSGLKGEKGDAGSDGTIGVKGDTGDKGQKGDYGSDGAKGDKGDSGEGADGAKGDKGDKGDQGDKGNTGDKGDQGDKGNTGDKGDKGDIGDKGDGGDKGDQGDKGEALYLANIDGGIPSTIYTTTNTLDAGGV